MKTEKYLGSNETTEQMMARSFILMCIVTLSLVLAVIYHFDENPLFLLCLAALTLPMSFRLGKLLFPQSNYLQILSDIRTNKTVSDSPKATRE